MPTEFLTGNFNESAQEHKGWVIGHFMEPDSPFRIGDFEIKWSNRKKGDVKTTDSGSEVKTVSILVHGKFLLRFPSLDKEFVLEKEGDYLFYSSSVPHITEALEDSLVIVIRWPSIPPEKK